VGEELVFVACAPFDQYVGSLLSSQHIGELDGLGFELVPKEMVANVDMFGAVMELGVPEDGDSGLVVNKESGRGVVGEWLPDSSK
jgi:hypothetical protein